jgi:ATP-dependent Clp protease adaptor protein ClpS
LSFVEKRDVKMPDQGKQPGVTESEEAGGTAVATPNVAQKQQTVPAKNPPSVLPPWKVLLHNDEKNEMLFVIRAIVELTPLNREDALTRMLEAHKSGVALLLITHKERAELYLDQFQTKGLTISIEPEN